MADEDLLGLFWPAATTPGDDPFASLAAPPPPSPPAPAAPAEEDPFASNPTSLPPAQTAPALIGKDTTSGSAGRIGNDKKSDRRSTSDLAKAKKHRSRQSMPAANDKRKSSTDAYYEKRKSASGAGGAPSKSSNGRLSALDAKKGGTGRSPPTSRSNNNRPSTSRYKPVSKTTSRGTRTSTSSSAGAAAQSSSSRNKGGEKMRARSRSSRGKLYQGSRSSTARQLEDNKPQGSGTRRSSRNTPSEQPQGSSKRATSSRADQRTSNFGGAAPWATTPNKQQTTTTKTTNKNPTRDRSSSSEWRIDDNVGMNVSDDDDIDIFAKEDISCSSSDSEDDSEFNKWEEKESKSKESEPQTTTTTTSSRHTKSRKSTSSLLRKTTAGRSSDQITSVGSKTSGSKMASSNSNRELRRNTATNTRISSDRDLLKMAKDKIAEHERHQKQERRGSKSALLGPATSKNKLERKLSNPDLSMLGNRMPNRPRSSSMISKPSSLSPSTSKNKLERKLSTPDLSMLGNRMTVATKKGSATSPPLGFRRRRRSSHSDSTEEVMVDIVNDSKDDNGMQNSNHSLPLADYYRGRHSRHDIDKTKSVRSSSLDSARNQTAQSSSTKNGRLPRRNSDMNYAQYYEQIKETEELKRPVVLSRQDSTSGRNTNKGMVKSNSSRRLLSTRATSSSSLKPLARRNSTEDMKKLKKRQARNNDVRRLSNSWTERSFRGSTTSSRLSASLQPNNFSLQGEEYEVGSDTDRDVSTSSKSKRSSESLNRVLDRLGSMEDKVYSTSITSSKIGDSGGDDENNGNNIEKSKVQKEKDEDGYADDNNDDDVLQMFDGMRKIATKSTDASDKSKKKKKEQDSLEESQSSSSNTKEKEGSLEEKKKRKPESSSSKSRGSGLFKRFSTKSRKFSECTAEASTSTAEDEDAPDGENETIKSKDSSKGSSKKSRASTVNSKTSNATDDENETIKSKDSSKGSSKKSRASTVNSKTSKKSNASTVNSKRSQRSKKTAGLLDEEQGDDEEDKSNDKNKKKRWWKKGSSSEVPDTSAETSLGMSRPKTSDRKEAPSTEDQGDEDRSRSSSKKSKSGKKKKKSSAEVHIPRSVLCMACLCYCISLLLVGAVGFGIHLLFFTEQDDGSSSLTSSYPENNTASSGLAPVAEPGVTSSYPDNNTTSSGLAPVAEPGADFDDDVVPQEEGGLAKAQSILDSLYAPSTSPSALSAASPSPSTTNSPTQSAFPSISPSQTSSMQPSEAKSESPSQSPTGTPQCPEILTKSIVLEDNLLTMKYDIVEYNDADIRGGLFCVSLEYAGPAAWMGLAFSEASRDPQFGKKEAVIGFPGVSTTVAMATSGPRLGQQIAPLDGGPVWANPGKYTIPAGGTYGYYGPALNVLSSKQTLKTGSMLLQDMYDPDDYNYIPGNSITRLSFTKYLREENEIEIKPYESTLMLWAVATTDGDGNPEWKYAKLTLFDQEHENQEQGTGEGLVNQEQGTDGIQENELDEQELEYQELLQGNDLDLGGLIVDP